MESDELDLCEYHFLKALEGEAFIEELIAATIWMNLATLNVERHHYDRALEIFIRSLARAKKIGNKRLLTYGYKKIARVYEILGK